MNNINCQYARFHHAHALPIMHQAPPLEAGEHVMVVDALGGTVDITLHECVARGGQVVLAEAVSAAGGHFGSTTIDANFECVLPPAVCMDACFVCDCAMACPTGCCHHVFRHTHCLHAHNNGM